MVFDKIKNVFSGGDSNDMSDLAGKVGMDQYSKYLEGVSFPASKDELLGALQANGATDAIVEHVKSLAGDRFNSADDVFKNILK